MALKNTFLVKKRLDKNLSQQEVADIAGIDRSYYTKIENGLIPSVKVAQALADKNCLDFDWTIFFENNHAKSTQTA